jgi:sugar O-acyltransferase (sialic acid O-acetyltransferase NeuD family)
MRRLAIVGAGGFARETAELVGAINRVSPTWELEGHLDDNAALHGSMVSGVVVIGPIDSAVGDDDLALVVCIGSPRDYSSRRRVVERLDLPAERYATLVHPAAVVPRRASIGAGTVIHATTVLTTDVTIGSHVAVMPSVVLTHDDVIDDYVTFGAGVRVAGGVTIETGAYVGSSVSVREGLTIGAWSLIGMGSVVTRSVPRGQVWFGSPARYVRDATPTSSSLVGATLTEKLELEP